MATTAGSRPISLVLAAGAPAIVVPRLQRPYSWESAETRELWQDIVSFHERFPGDNLAGHEYFLGSIVGRTTAVEGRDVMEVLDGQQRLATLTILFAALRDILADFDATSAQAIQMMNIAQFVGLGEAPRYLLSLNRVDREFFQNLVQVWPRPAGLALPEAKTASHRLIDNASTYFRSQLRLYADEKGINVGTLATRLHTLLTQNVHVVVVASESWDDTADIFERLNDRGKGLSTLDLLRNYLIAKAPQHQQDAVEESWNEVYELSDSAAKVDAFLRHVWVTLRGDVKSRSLYKEIKAVMDDPAQPPTITDPFIFSSNLASDTVFYARLLAAEHSDPECVRHLRAIQLLGSAALMPPALSALVALEEGDQRELLRAVISTFVRFNMITSGESTELEAAAYSVARDIRAGGTVQAALDHLRPLLRADDDVKNAFRSLSFARAGYQRYVLEELERYLTLRAQHGGDPPDPQQATEIGPAGSAVLWIEHVYPQSPDATWGRWPDHDDVINRLGNLTLIHRKLNAAAQNALFDEKKHFYTESQLRLNQWICEQDEWTLAQIDERQRDLSECVPKLWSRF